MRIYQYEKTAYPNTIKGRLIADEMEQKLRNQGCFLKRSEDTQVIVIESEYHFSIKEDEDGEGI